MNIIALPQNLARRRARSADETMPVTPEPTFKPLNPRTLTVDIVVPVYNEHVSLVADIERLDTYLKTQLPYRYNILIVDNGSVDNTWELAEDLVRRLPSVKAMHMDAKGRGRALKAAWTKSTAYILAYMDVDLSTSLDALPELLRPLVSGEAPVAIGSRLRKDSKVTRGAKREFVSRAYNFLLRRMLHVKFSDAQCGFKAIRRDAAAQILPDVADKAWFFDTELLFKAEQRGWPIHEVGVEWTEDTDSRVNIPSTAWEDWRGIVRLRREAVLAPSWEWPAYAALGLGALALFMIGLSASGYANSFYAAAVQAGTESWKAFFFGSFDSSNFITVDKPPFALWVMELSGRIFGFSSWSMLLPNALAGAASVMILARLVRRWYGPLSGLIAGASLALTPVAVLMFRFNNPDTILILLFVLAAYCMARAIESGKTAWLAGIGVLLGTAFITKMFQGLILVPIFAAVYLLAGPPKLWKRIWQLLIAGVALTVSALWWPIIVTLTPAANRPYIGGSTDNSIWNLIFGYNGLGRLAGTAVGSPGTLGRATGTATTAGTNAAGAMGAMPTGGGGGGMGGTAFGGTAGIWRMLNAAFGTEISWLLPLALGILVLGLWTRRRKPRTDLIRAGYLLWGGWLLVHMIVFSFMKGTIHPYYSVALAPAVAALVGLGLPYLWKIHNRPSLAWIWPAGLLGTGIWAWILLERTPTFVPWLKWIIVAGSLIGAVVWPLLTSDRGRKIAAGFGLSILLAGPVSYSLATAAQAHSGSIPISGPTTSAMGGGGGIGGPGGMTGQTSTTSQTGSTAGTTNATAPTGTTAGGGMGGGMGEETTDTALVNYLVAHKGSATWIAATTSTITAAPLELGSGGQPVLAMGGFNGSDPTPTLAQFKALVAAGKLKYVVLSSGGMGGFGGGEGGGGGMGRIGSTSQTEITNWVKANGTLVNYGGTATLYELSN